MALLVYSVVRRHMKRSPAFTLYAAGMALPAGLEAPDEEIIGWYRNPSPWQDEYVVFTSVALHCLGGARSERIALTDIVDFETPRSKVDVSGVRLRTVDGFRFVRISGSNGPDGRFRDAFNFIMVVLAVLRSRAHAGQSPK